MIENSTHEYIKDVFLEKARIAKILCIAYKNMKQEHKEIYKESIVPNFSEVMYKKYKKLYYQYNDVAASLICNHIDVVAAEKFIEENEFNNLNDLLSR